MFEISAFDYALLFTIVVVSWWQFRINNSVADNFEEVTKTFDHFARGPPAVVGHDDEAQTNPNSPGDADSKNNL